MAQAATTAMGAIAAPRGAGLTLPGRPAARISLPKIQASSIRAQRTRSVPCCMGTRPGKASRPSGPPPRPFVTTTTTRDSTATTAGPDLPPCRAVAADSSDAGANTGGTMHTLYLGCLFALWYTFSVGFGVFNKQVLNVFPYPTTLTLLNLAVGSTIACVLWLTGVQKRPKLNKKTLLAILPLAVVHTIGNLLTNISLGKVAVSFTHTIKSCEPFFSVLFSALFLGDIPSVALVASLVPVVGGIALASFTEPSFNWIGLFAALGSNVTFTSRNVFSKKVMANVKLDNINLFSVITMMSMCMCAPITLAMDGFQLTPTFLQSAMWGTIASKAIMAGICFHAYQQVSYMVLQNVTPVTHSVGKCVKSVVVIVASIIAFQNPIGPLNAVGTAIALVGVCLYSYVKTKEKQAKAAAAAAAISDSKTV